MKFEDLTNQQLKKILSIYKYNLLEPIKGYGKEKRERLIQLCTDLLIIDNEKIKPKVIEPITFDIPPKPTRRRRKVVEKTEKKEVEKPEKKEVEKPEKKEVEKPEKKEVEKQEKNNIENKVYILDVKEGNEIIKELHNIELPQKEFNLIKKNKQIIIKNPKNTIFTEKEIPLLNKVFTFSYSKKYLRDDYKGIILLSFTILNNKIFLNGWSEITEMKNGDCFIELLNGYKGGGTNIINYMKKYVGEKNYFYLSSLSSRATVDFYRKMGLKRESSSLDFFIKANIADLSKRKKQQIIKEIKDATDYDILYRKVEDLFSRGENFYYFPNKEIQESRYYNTKFELVPTGREWTIALVKVILSKSEKEAEDFVDKLINKTKKEKGYLEGTGRFLD
jgi:hypothetical protein